MRTMLTLVVLLAVASPGAAAERPQPPASFAPVVEAVKRAVITVVIPPDPDADEGDDGDVVRRLFDALTSLPNRTLGAAVMVDAGGVAVTGARLLRGRAAVDVIDVDGRRFRATVVGRDERTDLAVLRVAGPGPFPAARLANSDEVHVGDWVLALGSPFGFEATVSAGIVSARPRAAAGAAPGDSLQTDAAINPGSAGGPLVDVRGDVVGVASIAAPRGSGIGFAVPSNVVRRVVDDILAHGKVVRSWLGVELQPLTADLAAAFRVPFTGGLLLVGVSPGGPAAAAGLSRGAIVVAFNGGPLRTVADLEHALAATPPGRTVVLHVWRAAREATVRVVLAQEPGAARAEEWRWEARGLAVEAITPEAGVVIARVTPGGPAETVGLLRGDVVRELDHRTIRVLDDFEEAARAAGKSRRVPLLVQRGRTSFYLVLAPER